jgi:Arc/MetJ-type ribon-helix-helix transcriptional regulator
MTSTSPDKPVASQRLTVCLPVDLCNALDALVEEGQFPHRSAVIRTALHHFITATDVQARSLDVYPARRLADETDWTVDFKAREVAAILNVTPDQLAQSIQHHRELEHTLVVIEPYSTGASRGTLWQATPWGPLPQLPSTEADAEAPDD